MPRRCSDKGAVRNYDNDDEPLGFKNMLSV